MGDGIQEFQVPMIHTRPTEVMNREGDYPAKNRYRGLLFLSIRASKSSGSGGYKREELFKIHGAGRSPVGGRRTTRTSSGARGILV